MPELRVGNERWQVPAGTGLLEALNSHGTGVPSSCRAGHCHTCRVRCVAGLPHDQRPHALPASEYAQGWRLACQCQVSGDLEIVPYNAKADGTDACVSDLQWLSSQVLRVRLAPVRPVRYQAGQHVVVWTPNGVARPYSLAGLPGEAPWLELHVQCGRPGAFVAVARALKVGDHLRLGEVLGGPLHYDPAWASRPLWLLASGTGLAPLWAVLREALRQGHAEAIRLVHMAAPGEHYLEGELQALAARHANLELDMRAPVADLNDLRPVRHTIALACGAPALVEAIGKRLFMAGLPRGQLLTDTFEKSAG
jgi:NAD(P)H-flavin reductase/ferredoxin